MITKYFEQKIPFINLDEYEFESEIVSIIPLDICIFYNLIVIDQIDNSLTLAIEYKEQYDIKELRKLKEGLGEKFGYVIQLVFADSKYIEEGLNKFHSKAKANA